MKKSANILGCNIRALCDQYASVAHVCRSIGINRQQFNKYLSGNVSPSRHNLEKICSFFDIEKEVLLLDEKSFQDVIEVRKQGKPLNTKSNSSIDLLLENLPASNLLLDRYIGYYRLYFHSLGYPGYIISSLLKLYRDGDRFYTSSIEHLWDKSNENAIRQRFKYSGVVIYLADRIYITDIETLSNEMICYTALYPCYRSSLDFMSGITCGVGSHHTRTPRATRVEYEFLGKTIDIRQALTSCSLYKMDSNRISDDIKKRIANDIGPADFMLTAYNQ